MIPATTDLFHRRDERRAHVAKLRVVFRNLLGNTVRNRFFLAAHMILPYYIHEYILNHFVLPFKAMLSVSNKIIKQYLNCI